MYRIDDATSVASEPTPAAPGTPGYFTGGNTVSGSPPTQLTPEWFNGVQEELMTFLTAAGIGESKTAHNQAALAVQSGLLNYSDDTGIANAYVATLPIAPTLGNGLPVTIKIEHTNTAASTLNVNGTGAKAITYNGSALLGGELTSGVHAVFNYDLTTTSWQLVSGASGQQDTFSTPTPATGTANALVLAAVQPAGYALNYGNIVTFTAGLSNTGAATLNVAGTGVKNIMKGGVSGLVAVAVGDIIAGNEYTVGYNGSSYVLQDPTFSPSAFLQAANNLSDLASAATARTNLGLGTAAVLASTAVAQTANNLSDLANATTARTNLGGTAGVWGAAIGGTGVANNAACTLTRAGNFGLTLTLTATTSLTAPTSGTLYGTLSASITSSQLQGSMTDNQGTGRLVFDTNPTLTTPTIAGGTVTGTLAVPTATTGTNTTQVASCANVLANIAAQTFTSASQACTAAATGTLTHGLSVAPTSFSIELTNVTGELAYTAGQVVVWDGQWTASGGSGLGVSAIMGATTIVYRVGSGSFALPNASTGVPASITPANWTFKLIAKI